MPYFCLRVPTGGGKTWLAAKSVHVVNTYLLRCEHSVILWLVPSRPIRDQTLKGLQDRNHPYHTALRDAGPVTVMSLDEAKSVTRATLDTSTTIIVATRQAFQVEDEECRKVYQSSGALMHHFDNLSPEQRTDMDTLNVERVRNELLSNHIIPPEEIVVATGDERGLDQIQADYAQGIADPACPVKFVITQRALAEGWDCPFAYILVGQHGLPAFGHGGGTVAWARVAPAGSKPSHCAGTESIVCLCRVAKFR